MRTKFEQDLKKLSQDMYLLTELVKKSIRKSIDALNYNNIKVAKEVIEKDEEINQLYVDIGKDCFRLISLQQPNSRDLRKIISVLKVVTDLERIADHSVSIAKVAIRLENEEVNTELTDFKNMAELAIMMLENMLEAHSNEQIDLIYQIANKDEELDELHKKLYKEWTEHMESQYVSIIQGTQLLFVAHHLERIGDHITNLGEWFIYQITGDISVLN